MDAEAKLTLQVIEIIQYSEDVNAAVEFYHGKLDWPVIWQSSGNLAIFDAGWAYQVVVCSTAWSDGWQEGDPLPRPVLSLESQDLAADKALLEARGVAGLEISGDPANMLTMSIMGPAGLELFVWEDSGNSGATKMAEDFKAKRAPGTSLYEQGECLFFVDDKSAEEAFYIEKLGFSVKERHGDVFTSLSINGGPVLGIYDQTDWWEEGSKPEVPVRLFLECPDIAAEHARQTAAGAAPGAMQAKDGGLKWFNTNDPDGNTMTFWQYVAE